jgi:hypothetical protein
MAPDESHLASWSIAAARRQPRRGLILGKPPVLTKVAATQRLPELLPAAQTAAGAAQRNPPQMLTTDAMTCSECRSFPDPQQLS